MAEASKTDAQPTPLPAEDDPIAEFVAALHVTEKLRGSYVEMSLYDQGRRPIRFVAPNGSTS